jgi:endonuclease-3
LGEVSAHEKRNAKTGSHPAGRARRSAAKVASRAKAVKRLSKAAAPRTKVPAALAKTSLRHAKPPAARAKSASRRAKPTAPRETNAARRAKAVTRRRLRGDAGAVLERLARAIIEPHVELAFGDPWQLLVAVILSAQSTDRRVNQVTPEVFRRWPSPAALARAVPAEVEEVIKSTGFFRNKTKAIIGASALISERFAGQVPREMDQILEVPGVARKTANVVLGSAYHINSGIVVDTHAARVAQRLELTKETAPEKIELDLCRAFPRERWIQMSHRLVLHGRYVCTAKAPACATCPLNEVCPSRQGPGLLTWEQRAEREATEMEARAVGFSRV